jgi:HrpA-like RNA helicase
LFSEDLSSFKDKIEDKNNFLEEILDDYRRKEEAEKLSEEISELDTTLNDYTKVLAKFQGEYISVEGSTLDKATKDWKVHMIYKQLRILRNQLGSELPIISRKRALFEKLDKENLVILEGETGSGKSTQLPQMLCEYYKIFTDPKARPIVLTQPRKLSTRSLAERIAFEMDEKLHGFVDYVSSSGKNSLPSPDCKILVKLDRLLLDEIEEDPLL